MAQWLSAQAPRANLLVALGEFADSAPNPGEQLLFLLSNLPRFNLERFMAFAAGFSAFYTKSIYAHCNLALTHAVLIPRIFKHPTREISALEILMAEELPAEERLALRAKAFFSLSQRASFPQAMEKGQKPARAAAVFAHDFVTDLAFNELAEHDITAVALIVRAAPAIIPKIAAGNTGDFFIKLVTADHGHAHETLQETTLKY
jgi:hypothetical protein